MARRESGAKLPKAAVDKLASSGLSPKDAEELGITFVPDASQLHHTFSPVPALRFTYPALDGSDSGFYRVRYLEAPPGWAGLVERPRRYAQEPGTTSGVYLPSLVDWAALSQASDVPVLITEGELKAACALRNGFACIGLGGVSSWRSAARQVALMPPLDRFNWRGRPVTVVFDSDAASNPDVAREQVTLARMLLLQGARPSVASLPVGPDGAKQGLDDFIVAGGDLADVVEHATSLELGDRLTRLNERYVFLLDQDVVVDLSAMGVASQPVVRRMKRDTFVNGVEATNRVVESVPGPRGTTNRVVKSVAAEWLKWPARRDVASLVYEPGAPRFTANGSLNTWQGWGCEPKEGSVAPWTELLDHLFTDAAEARSWFERWCAYPLQHPGTKLFTAAVLWGPETGTGKSLIGYTLGRVYGGNFCEIGNAELHMAFNEWAINKQFVMGEEITGSDKRTEADRLKSLITQRQLRINMKHLPTYTVPDCINFYFNSNHPDAFFIDDHDRRFFVHRTAKPRLPSEFYARYSRWLNGPGPAALFHYMLHLDLGDFNPAAPAPLTESKLEMIDHARSDLSSWTAHFAANIDTELERLGGLLGVKTQDLDLVLNRHLRMLYDPENQARVTANGMGRELSRFGFKTKPPVMTEAFGKTRFYIVRNADRWLAASNTEVRDHVNRVFKPSHVKH